MTKTTAIFTGVTKEKFLELLEGYNGLVVTGAQEEEIGKPDAEDCVFYSANMWEDNVENYGFGEYDHVEVRTVYSTEDGSPLFCYLALVMR